MSRRRKGLVTAVLLMSLGVIAHAQISFRSAVDSVALAVSVRQDGRLIRDLTLGDFTVVDAGQPQQLTDLSFERLPSDVTFVVDLSGSISISLLETLTAAVETVRTQLRPDDRASLITFSHRVRERQPMTKASAPFQGVLGPAEGATSLVDAITLALVAPQDPERGRLVVVFSDGRDTSSFLEGTALLEIAARRDAAIFVVALEADTPTRGDRGQVLRGLKSPNSLFNRLAGLTGGQSIFIDRRADVGSSFLRAFEEFKSSYVLRYTYRGPDRPGWHDVVVKVRSPKSYDVRARQGYQVR
jgi:VWFA-related protein